MHFITGKFDKGDMVTLPSTGEDVKFLGYSRKTSVFEENDRRTILDCAVEDCDGLLIFANSMNLELAS